MSAIAVLRQAALLSLRATGNGAQPEEIATCNSVSSASRYSLAMISALMVERRLPSHIAIAWSQAFSYWLLSNGGMVTDMARSSCRGGSEALCSLFVLVESSRVFARRTHLNAPDRSGD